MAASLEAALERIGALDQLTVVVTGVVLLAASGLVSATESRTVLFAGLAGLVTYLAVFGLDGLFAQDEENAVEAGASGRPGAAISLGTAGLSTFLYLEVLDASFSFDGVIGAFAISQNVLTIAAGWGIGALFVRSVTVHLVRQGTLAEYRYLEHGAHGAIGALAVCLLVQLRFHIPEAVTGLLDLGRILAAYASLVCAIRRDAARTNSTRRAPGHVNTRLTAQRSRWSRCHRGLLRGRAPALSVVECRSQQDLVVSSTAPCPHAHGP